MTLKIRSAALKDIDAIHNIELGAFDATKYELTPRRQLSYLMKHGNADILVAEETGIIYGTAIIFYRKTSSYGRFYSLAIAPEAQGKNLGKILFQHVEEHIRKRKLKGVLCEIRKDNAKLYERYLSLGYKPVREVKDYYPDGCDGIKLLKEFI